MTREESGAIQFDHGDLVAILARRFGFVSETVKRTIRSVDDAKLLDKLIDDALEVEDWEGFVQRLREGLNTCPAS